MLPRCFFAFLATCCVFVTAPNGAEGRTVQDLFAAKIPDQNSFDRLKRVYHNGRFAEIPHILFIVERQTHKVFFAQSGSFDFHGSFARALKLTKANDKLFFLQNYTDDQRPMILGTLAYYPAQKQMVFEYSEADHLSAALVQETFSALNSVLFTPPAYMPNTLAQEIFVPALKGILTVRRESLQRPPENAVFRDGKATGRLVVIGGSTIDAAADPDSVVVFETPPVHVNPVRAIITSLPSSPLSHVHMLARSWHIPDVMMKDAVKKLAPLAGTWVTIEATAPNKILVRPATAREKKRRDASSSQAKVTLPPADLSFHKLLELSAQTKADIVRVGTKSANLGTVMRIKSVRVPPGFGIPFAYYAEHFKKSGAEKLVRKFMKDAKFQKDPAVRKEGLAAVRDLMEKAPEDATFFASLLEKYSTQFNGRGVFVRSSTNAEDLPGFNGAGLYTTVPNVKEPAALGAAVKTVWASLWNFEAFEARQAAGIDHFAVNMGVLVQLGVNAESAGVLITKNPFSADDKGSVYINAKRGLGMKVVDGKALPEQILFKKRKNSAIVLSRSEEPSYLTFADQGGLKEVPIEANSGVKLDASDDGLRVLTDALVRQLVANAHVIKAAFGGVDQDIEWTVMKNAVGKAEVWIVQSRPYVE